MSLRLNVRRVATTCLTTRWNVVGDHAARMSQLRKSSLTPASLRSRGLRSKLRLGKPRPKALFDSSLCDGHAIVAHARPSNVDNGKPSLSAEGHVFVGNRPPVLVREGVSFAVQIFKGTLHKKDDLAVFLEHQRMNGAGRFMNDVTGPRYPVVFQIPPCATQRQPEDRPVMAVNPKIATRRPSQFCDPMASRWISLDQLHFTSACPVRKPRCVIRGNVHCVKCTCLHHRTSIGHNCTEWPELRAYARTSARNS